MPPQKPEDPFGNEKKEIKGVLGKKRNRLQEKIKEENNKKIEEKNKKISKLKEEKKN